MAAFRIQSAEQPDRTPRTDGVEWVRASSVKAEKVPWLLPGRIPCNGITLLEGHMSTGKSTFLAELAAVVTRGKPFLRRKKSRGAGVLWLAAEEDAASDVVPRLKAAGADVSRVHFAPKNEHGLPLVLRLPAALGSIRDAMASLRLGLVILDPLVSFIGSEVDLNNEAAVRAVLDPLHAVAALHRCAVIGTRHLRKDRSGPRIHQGLGSVGIGNTARAILHLEHPDEHAATRLLRHVKVGRGKLAPLVQFTLVDKDGIGCVGEVKELGAKDDDPSSAESDPGERSALQDAMILLRKLLADNYVSVKAIEAEAQAAMVAPRTLRTAKARLRVHSRRVGDASPPYWEWGPPEKGWD